VSPPPVDQRRNQFQLIRKPYKVSLKKSAQAYISTSKYAPYIITNISHELKTMKIESTDYNSNVKRNIRYLFLKLSEFSKYIGNEGKISTQLYNAYNSTYGIQAPNHPSNKNFPVNTMKIPLQMPSRGSIFR
jgi:hypothetical protein